MTSEPFGLDTLLRPLDAAAFFSRHWEREYCWLARNDPSYYQSLISAADLESLISDSDARYPAIRLAKGGGYYPPEIYTHNVKHGDETFSGVPDVRRISEEYRQGATVALPAIHRTWKPLGLLCDRLQAQLDHAVHANVYLTPGNAAGFTPHYDVHEVFVLQIAGKKRWSLYEPVLRLPHRTQLFTPKAYAGQAPMAVVDLQPGDLLYLPRGYLHSTTTSDSFSAHVTLGITVYTWADLLREYLQSAIEDVHMRAALPPGFAGREELQPVLRQGLIQAVERLDAVADPQRLIDAFTARVRAARVPRPEPFRADVMVITEASTLAMPPVDTYRLIDEDGKTRLEFKGMRYALLPAVAATLRAMTSFATFRVIDLPDTLDRDGRLGLCRHLHDIGFLALVRNSGADATP